MTTQRDPQGFPKYRYTALGPGHKSRLIEIQPGPTNAALLQISIIQTKFDVPYDALSWCWGAEGETASVVVVETGSKHHRLNAKSKSILDVKPTLREAIRSLRLKTTVRRLWIDAICINQHDDTEKSIQVGHMASVYKQARMVCIWLPVGNAAHTASIINHKKSHTPKGIQKLMRDSDESRHAISRLLESPWFGRRWIVPEVSLAPQATIVLGLGHEAKWESFTSFVFVLRQYYEDGHYHDRPTTDMDMTVEAHTRAFYASSALRLVELVANLRKSGGDTTSPRTHQLEDVLCFCASFQCQRGQDVVYALLPLASDVLVPGPAQLGCESSLVSNAHGFSFRVDYTQSTLEVYQQLVQFAIRSAQGRTDVILRHWAPLWINDYSSSQQPAPRLSWLRPPPVTAKDGDHRTVQQRELTGTAHHPLFSASGTCEHWRSPEQQSLFRATGFTHLHIDIIFLDTISSTLSSTADTISRTWPSYAGWLDKESPPPEHFWQTLVAGLDHNNQPIRPGTNTPAQHTLRKACHDAFRHGGDFSLYCRFVSETVLFELKRLFCPEWSSGDAKSDSLADLRERWRRLNFSLRHPDQQLHIAHALRRIAADGSLEFPFLRYANWAANYVWFKPWTYRSVQVRYPLSPTALRFLREEVLEAVDMEAMQASARYRKLVHATTLGRSLFKSEGQLDLFGLVPSQAKKADCICILRGCSVPVVLRQIPATDDGDGDRYAIVGQAYVHGMMHGEALTLGRPWKGISIQ